MVRSAYELQTQLIIADKLNFIDEKSTESILEIIDEIQKMNYKLQLSLSK